MSKAKSKAKKKVKDVGFVEVPIVVWAKVPADRSQLSNTEEAKLFDVVSKAIGSPVVSVSYSWSQRIHLDIE